MRALRSEVWLGCPDDAKLSWLVEGRCADRWMVRPTPLMITTGSKAEDGLLEYSAGGESWIAFEQGARTSFSGSLAQAAQRLSRTEPSRWERKPSVRQPPTASTVP